MTDIELYELYNKMTHLKKGDTIWSCVSCVGGSFRWEPGAIETVNPNIIYKEGHFYGVYLFQTEGDEWQHTELWIKWLRPRDPKFGGADKPKYEVGHHDTDKYSKMLGVGIQQRDKKKRRYKDE